jgi:hypothetical protein
MHISTADIVTLAQKVVDCGHTRARKIKNHMDEGRFVDERLYYPLTSHFYYLYTHYAYAHEFLR